MNGSNHPSCSFPALSLVYALFVNIKERQHYQEQNCLNVVTTTLKKMCKIVCVFSITTTMFSCTKTKKASVCSCNVRFQIVKLSK